MAAPKQLPIDGEIKMQGVPFQLDDAYLALKIDPNHVIDQLVEQPSLYSYWSILSEEADVLLLSAKRRLDRVEADLDDRLRREARDEGETLGRGGVTETVIQRRIVREDEYRDAQDAMFEARRNAAYLGVIKRALEQRLSALIAVNNRDRAEMAAVGREGS